MPKATPLKGREMKVFFNQGLPAKGESEKFPEQVWVAQNGATRRTLVVINKTGMEIPANQPFRCQLGFLNKGNHSFIFINPPRKGDNRTMGVFLNTAQGFDVINKYGAEAEKDGVVFSASSVGGYGNSESRMAVIRPGFFVAENSYKNRRGYYYWRFDPEEGWIDLGRDVPLSPEEIQEI